ncbi:MAG: exodeoxyribonuclease V subunit alpha, partial [Acidimicrobiales bacterium]
MSAPADPALLGDVGDDGPAMFEPGDVRLALHGPDTLRPWNELGVLIAADLHVAGSLARAGTDQHPDLLLAAALAVRALRLGHVCVDLSTVATTVTTDLEPASDLSNLPWPEPERWVESVASSAVVALGDDDPAEEPLRLVGPRLYLDRYWHQERQVAADLRARSLLDAPLVDGEALGAGLDALFGVAAGEGTADAEGGRGDPGEATNLQRLAAANAVASHLSLVAGGPGTGKTTTVARILALLELQAEALGQPPPRVALAAPTGKAAARLQEAVHTEAGRLPLPEPLRQRLLATEASTLHRLLGWRPGSQSRFRHDRRNRLPHTVVIVDETSMLSLSLMAKLVDAVRPQARLVLVGDPQQLASVEAGAVLGDIVGPVETGLRMTGAARARLARLTGQPVPAIDPPAGTSVGDGIVVLRHVHRFGGGIAALADAVRAGDADTAVGLLGDHRHADDVRWLDVDITDPVGAGLAAVASDVTRAGGALPAAAQSGDGAAALAALASTRILCPHRRGPAGVE